MEAVLDDVSFEEYYMGICYVAQGRKGRPSQ
jgi:hypothetical protein